MKSVVPKLSLWSKKPVFVAPRITTQINKVTTLHLPHRVASFSATQAAPKITREHINDKVFDLLPQFNSNPPETGYNPRNVLFVNDVTANKQLLYTFFNKVGRLSENDTSPVYRVKLFADQKRATILFKDARSVDHVMQQYLTLDGKPLVVARHKLVDFWNMMEPSKNKVLLFFSNQPDGTPEELEQFLTHKLELVNKDFQVQPFVKFVFHKTRGVMEFPSEQDAEKATTFLKFLKFGGQAMKILHMKPQEIKQVKNEQLLLAKEDELFTVMRSDVVGFLHPQASSRIQELLSLGYNFKNARIALIFRVLKHLRFTRDLETLKTVCEQLTTGLKESSTASEAVLGILIQGWGFLNEPEKVDECVQILKQHFTELSSKTYLRLMEAYRLTKNGSKLLQLYDFLKSQDMDTPAIIASVLKSFEPTRDMQAMLNVIEEAQSKANNKISSWHYVILIGTIREAKQFDKIPAVIQHMKQNSIPIDFSITTALMHAHAAAGNINATLKQFEEMKIQGWIPLAFHYHYIIKAHKQAKFFDGQMKWFRKLLEDGLLPTPGIIMAMLSSAMAEGRDQEIQEILDSLKLSPPLQHSIQIITLVRKYHRCKEQGLPWVDPKNQAEIQEEVEHNENFEP